MSFFDDEVSENTGPVADDGAYDDRVIDIEGDERGRRVAIVGGVRLMLMDIDIEEVAWAVEGRGRAAVNVGSEARPNVDFWTLPSLQDFFPWVGRGSMMDARDV